MPDPQNPTRDHGADDQRTQPAGSTAGSGVDDMQAFGRWWLSPAMRASVPLSQQAGASAAWRERQAEILQLRAALDAARAEADHSVCTERLRTTLDERDEARATVERLERENAEWLERFTTALDDQLGLRNEIERLKAVRSAASELLAAPKCKREWMSFGHERCTPAGDACDLHRWHMLKHAVSLSLDASTAADAAGDGGERKQD